MKTYLKFLYFFAFIFCINAAEAKPIFKKKQTICLNMIVKDEKHVIKRCLESVKPIIDAWVIVDTGSTDGTQKVIKSYMKDIPGELYERPWVNFEHNRDEALQLAKGVSDYILFMDADDKLVFADHFVMPNLVDDCYMTVSKTGDGGTEYYFPRLIKSKLDWHWHGVLHEYVAASDARTHTELRGVEYAYLSGGARSRDAKTYYKDIKILEDALEKEPDNDRYMFYLAQSYLCTGDYFNAMTHYQLRADMGGWAEEVFWSKLQVANMQQKLNYDSKQIEESYYDAYHFRPSRVEPLYHLILRANWAGQYQKAYDLELIALKKSYPNDKLFVEKWMYDYGVLFEYSITAYWVGEYQESLDACDKLLKLPNLPKNYRELTISNRKFAVKKLAENKKKVQPIKPNKKK